MRIRVIKTKQNGKPMEENFEYSLSENMNQQRFLISVYPNIQYQTITGFGGAFTEAAAVTLNKLSLENQEKILKLYFDPQEGIGYNFGRVAINSCDFSLENYTYVTEGDQTLESFDIERDKQAVIPMIKGALKYNEIDIFASPWSPPAYMKTTNQMNNGGKLKKEYYELWSEYYVKFIQAYQSNGIEIKTITVQNEPFKPHRWESCPYTAEEERDFVKYHLGKKMQDLGVDILFWDHNKERVVDRAITMFSDEQTKNYIRGIAFHWYSGDYFEELEMFHKLYPDKDLIFSEGCYEYSRGVSDARKVGEMYAHDMIGNFNNYCNAFCDWNLLLNEQGGPNHVGNYCDAPIMADTANDTFEVHTSYYYIGHFSKYVQKGARRIGSSKFGTNIETVSFQNPNGSVVSIVLNRTSEDISFTFKIGENMIECIAQEHSIATYIFEDIS